ncbi:MAG: nicotinate-nucleotide adenylyltransferase [Pseudorhodoplanes sp.]
MTGRAVLPPHPPGLRIGLLGGSFNPPHAAHRAVSLFAMKRLMLDRVWWLVTPGNPLKDTRELPPLADRIAAAEKVAAHPRIAVSGIESVIRTQYSRDTLAYLIGACPGVHFVWLMGADNLRQLHLWKDWRGLAALAPIAVVDRGGLSKPALAAPAAQVLAKARIPESQAASLALRPPPAWVYLHGLKSSLSSTQIRAKTDPPGS